MNDEAKELLIRRETEIYSTYQRGDLDAIASVLADDFREIGSSGMFYSKADVLEAMKGVQVLEFQLDRFHVLPLSERQAIVMYVCSVRRVMDGQERSDRTLRSSTWVRRKNEWRLVFHQATPLEPATT
jgi:hypothetical protein